MTEVVLKEIEVPLVKIEPAPLVAAAEADRNAMATQAFESPLKEVAVTIGQPIIWSVAVFNRKGFESVHSCTESISVTFDAAH
ncbi:MAG: hypothetical protein LAQ69_11720 [Acidobacteriia bacterium]|nr:hypothetical protein [Terriglobia bacterium]